MPKLNEYQWDNTESYPSKEKSKKFLLDQIMNQFNISEEDLEDILIVKSKIRNYKISGILK